MRSLQQGWGTSTARAGLVCAASGLVLSQALGASEATPETRALWVLRSTLNSPDSIARMVETARDSGFNTLLVQVRGRGDAYFSGGLEPRATSLLTQAVTFDPLRETLDRAGAAGLQVHAWVNVNLVSSAADLPSSREHVVYRHPEWLMVPRGLADEMTDVTASSPAYVGRLARWTRARSEQVEGLYLSPLQPEAVDHTVAVVNDLVERYPLDGVHLDYVRYPGREFDHGPGALESFRDAVVGTLSADEQRRLEAAALLDRFAYVDEFPAEWARFRRSRLTSLVMRLRTVVKAARPGALLSAAVAPDQDEASDSRFQDWRTWLETGLLDAVCPMSYGTEDETFARQVAAARSIAGGSRLWVGIGAYRLSFERTLARIATVRRLGADGFALFSYDSLTDPSEHRADYLGQVARGAFASDHVAGGGGAR